MIQFKSRVFPVGKTCLIPTGGRRESAYYSLVAAGVTLACLSGVPVQAKPFARSQAAWRQVAGGDAALGPGDVISVTVQRHTDLGGDSITIPTSGQIDLPDAGAVSIAGQSPAQAARSIARALSSTLVDPQVTVALKQARPRLIVVIGAVAKTNSYPIQPGWRISEALAAAGGLPGREDETAGTLTRTGMRPVAIDLKAVLYNPSSPKNMRLREGDTLSFRALDTRIITISGAVQKPGTYPLRQAPRVLDAITAAGELKGFPDEISATLTRARQMPIALDLTAIQGHYSSRGNLFLKSGDVLSFVPLPPKIVRVSGDVAKPSTYPLRDAPRLLDALNEAGGSKEGVARTNVTVSRKNGQQIAIDLEQAEAQHSSKSNLVLEDGDFIQVATVPLLQVSVAGSGTLVRNSGNFQLLPASSAVQAIAQAGGLTVNADQVVTSVRRGGRGIPFDFARAVLDPNADVPLENGDTVLVNEPPFIRIQVAGAVNKQGALRPAPGTTLLDALNSGAGGLSIRPEEARISVVRTLLSGARATTVSTTNTAASISNALDTATQAGSATPAGTGVQAGSATGPKSQFEGDREVFTVDAVALLSRTDLSQNLVLQDGDLVSVTQVKTPTVIVSGQVAKPGPYQVGAGEGIAQLLARAGEATPNAALTQVVLQRGGQSRTLDVYNEVKMGQKPTVTLEDGDTVIVPENPAQVRVINAVQRPNFYPIPEHQTLTIIDAINAAGGARDRASVKTVVLLRPNPSAPNGVERRYLSLGRIEAGDLSQNVALRPGDIVYVPEAKASSGSKLFSGVGQVIGTLTGLRYLGVR